MKNITTAKRITPRDSDSLNLYLKEVAKEKLIDQNKEIELAKRIKAGDQSAMDELVRANLRFVITVAKQYQGRGLSLEDLIAEGNIGLIKAAQKFDETKGFHFISYAVWWIRQAILKAVYYTANDVRLPTSQIEPITKLNKIIADFEQHNGRKPVLEELAELSGYKEDYIRKVQLSSNKCVSIDTPTVDDSEDCTLADIIPNDGSDDPAELTDNTLISEGIDAVLSKLSNRDHDIVCMIYGLKGCHEMSFDEIARKFALSGERVRQLSHQLLKTFRTQYVNDFKALL
jgi:RNA polymerase primary sigma factor